MDRKPKISVIVPVYNVERYLARCVDSILAQGYANLDVILVDDGSSDGSGALCDAYAARDPRIRVIHKENGGLSSARNAGLDAAEGEYLAFADSDDWIEPEMYGTMLSLMEQYNAQVVCAGRYDVDGGTGEKAVGLCPREECCITGEDLVGRIFLWDSCDSSACDKLWRRDLFGSFRFPQGMVSEDVATIYRILLNAERAVLCPKPFYNYYHRPGSISMETVISEKTFHFSQHTEVIYAYIRQHHPAIEPQARYLRVRSLAHILLLLNQAKPSARAEFADRYRQAKKDLAAHLSFLLRCPWFTVKERITDLLLVLGLYRILRPVFHR